MKAKKKAKLTGHAGHGKCDRCQQQRTLFHHAIDETVIEEHDCPDCLGHELQSVIQRKLCSFCYQEEPTERVLSGDDLW